MCRAFGNSFLARNVSWSRVFSPNPSPAGPTGPTEKKGDNSLVILAALIKGSTIAKEVTHVALFLFYRRSYRWRAYAGKTEILAAPSLECTQKEREQNGTFVRGRLVKGFHCSINESARNGSTLRSN